MVVSSLLVTPSSPAAAQALADARARRWPSCPMPAATATGWYPPMAMSTRLATPLTLALLEDRRHPSPQRWPPRTARVIGFSMRGGQVFAYGDAGHPEQPGGGCNKGGFNPATAIFATSDGGGYWVTDTAWQGLHLRRRPQRRRHVRHAASTGRSSLRAARSECRRRRRWARSDLELACLRLTQTLRWHPWDRRHWEMVGQDGPVALFKTKTTAPLSAAEVDAATLDQLVKAGAVLTEFASSLAILSSTHAMRQPQPERPQSCGPWAIRSIHARLLKAAPGFFWLNGRRWLIPLALRPPDNCLSDLPAPWTAATTTAGKPQSWNGLTSTSYESESVSRDLPVRLASWLW